MKTNCLVEVNKGNAEQILQVVKSMVKEYENIKLEDFQDVLFPIYALRIEAFREINPEYCAENGGESLMIVSSLIAQEWLATGSLKIGEKVNWDDVIRICESYDIDIDGDVGRALLMDVAGGFLGDVDAGIINNKGEIINKSLLPKSFVMDVFQFNERHGIPNQAKKTLAKAMA